MTFREALREGSLALEGSGSETSYLDSLVMLAEAAEMQKERVYACLAEEVPGAIYARYHKLLERRKGGVPIAFLTRSKEFYGLAFYVDERVLIPRADTETLVEAALRLVDGDPRIRRVHDLGTGSGCIALTLKAERPRLELTASDASPDACAVFEINAARLGVEVPVRCSPFFDSIPGPFEMVVSNPPYLSDAEAAEMERRGWPEPQSALRAGEDGLDCIAQIVCKSVNSLCDPGWLLLEAAPAQMPMIKGMMKDVGFGGVVTFPDLAGRERVVCGARNG